MRVASRGFGAVANEKSSDKEIEHRRDEALRRAMNTPPKPHKATKQKKKREPGEPGPRRSVQGVKDRRDAE